MVRPEARLRELLDRASLLVPRRADEDPRSELTCSRRAATTLAIDLWASGFFCRGPARENSASDCVMVADRRTNFRAEQTCS